MVASSQHELSSHTHTPLAPPTPPPSTRPQGDFEELVGYEEDCTPQSLPEVSGSEYEPGRPGPGV